jgi:hypothetical protein
MTGIHYIIKSELEQVLNLDDIKYRMEHRRRHRGRGGG